MDILLKISSAFKYKKIGVIVICKRKSDYDISYFQVHRKENTVDICDKLEGLESFREISSRGGKYPLVISFQGIGLVQRIIKGNFTDIQQIIPNINVEEYLIESDKINHDEKLVVLCRKDFVETILERSEIKGLPIHSVSLGFHDVSLYVKLFPEEVNQFMLEEHALGFEGGRIVNIQKISNQENQCYFFANKLRKASEIVALAAGLEYFTKKNWKIFHLPSIKENIKEYTAKKLSFYSLYYLGPTLFLLLLLNFILFENFKTQHLMLDINSQEIISIESEVNSLQEDINVKKLFIQQNQVPDNYAFSYYIDQLASCVPDRIYLSKLSVSPVNRRIKEGELIKINSKTMIITGTAMDQTAFSHFINKINESYLVKKLDKQVYRFNNENNNGDFELEITLHDALD